MLRVSKSEHIFDPLQQLLSPSTVDSQSWSHRRLHWSMQKGTRINHSTVPMVPTQGVIPEEGG